MAWGRARRLWIVTLLSAMLCACDQTDVESGAQKPEREAIEAHLARGAWIDLSHDFAADTLYWPTAEGFSHSEDFVGTTDQGYYYSSYSIRSSEHGGTHLDAPVHFAEGRQSTDVIPLERLIAAAAVIDVSAQAAVDPDYQISVATVEAWEQRYGMLSDKSIVLFNTGWHRRWPDAEAYLGTAQRGAGAVAKLHFPGISPQLATWLVEQRTIAAVGIDTASIDFGQSTRFHTHRILFAQNIPAFENVANLDALPPRGALIAALPMKIRDGSGGPLRIVAWIPQAHLQGK